MINSAGQEAAFGRCVQGTRAAGQGIGAAAAGLVASAGQTREPWVALRRQASSAARDVQSGSGGAGVLRAGVRTLVLQDSGGEVQCGDGEIDVRGAPRVGMAKCTIGRWYGIDEGEDDSPVHGGAPVCM